MWSSIAVALANWQPYREVYYLAWRKQNKKKKKKSTQDDDNDNDDDCERRVTNYTDISCVIYYL